MKKSFYALLLLTAAAGAFAAEKVIFSEGFDNNRWREMNVSKSKDYDAKVTYSATVGNKKPGSRAFVLPAEVVPGKAIGVYTRQKPLDPAKTYICRVYIKPEKKCTSGSFSITIRPRDAKSGWLWNAKPFVKKVDLETTPTDKWTKVEVEFKSRPNDRFWQKGKYFISILTFQNVGGVTICMDDLEIIEK